MRGLYLLSVWLHILAAAAWIGGMVFLVLVLVPVLRSPEHRGNAAALVHRVGVRFRTLGWACLGLLVLSGGLNLYFRGVRWPDLWTGDLWQGAFGRTLAIKLLLVAAILMMSAIHDFSIGPRAALLLQANAGSPEAAKLRRQASWFGRLNLLVALVVVALGIMLVRGSPW